MDHRLQYGIEESEKYCAYPLNLIEIFFVVSIMGNIYGIVFLKDFVVFCYIDTPPAHRPKG